MQIFIYSFAFCRSITIVSSRFMVTWRASGNDRLKHFATWNQHILKVGVFNVCFPDCPYQFFQTLDSTTSISSHGKHLWIGETHGTDAICDPRLELLTTELCHPHQKITRHGFDEMRSALSRLCKNQKQCSPNFGVACLSMVDEDNAWMMRMLFHDIWCHLQYFDPRKVRAMQMQWHHKPFFSAPPIQVYLQSHEDMKSYNLWGHWIHSNQCQNQMPPRCCQKDLNGDFRSETTTNKMISELEKITSSIFPPTIKTRIFEAQLHGNKIWPA